MLLFCGGAHFSFSFFFLLSLCGKAFIKSMLFTNDFVKWT